VDDPPQYLVQQVKEALAADPQVASLDVRVRVVADEVYVQGEVATSERRAVVETVVTRLLPRHRVHNDVRVTGALEHADEEDLT